MKVTKLLGYQVLDSRGRPTVAASITLEDGTTHTARVPSGASTGKHEALELRDGDQLAHNNFYGALSVTKAVENVNTRIAPLIVGQQVDLKFIDGEIRTIDTTSNFSSLGANATIGSLADQQISKVAQWGQLPEGTLVTKTPVLFPRLETKE